MRVAIAVPWRSDGGRRDQLWTVCRKWLEQHHAEFAIYEGVSPEGLFDRGAAINDAARRAGDWDVALVADADVIAHPATVEQAITIAHETGCVVFPFETTIYLDGPSTDALIYDDNWFVVPYRGTRGYGETVKWHHYSSIQAVPRSAWDAVGGFISLAGWGAEDAVMVQLFEIYGNGVQWLHGSAFHLWHEPLWYAQPEQTAANRAVNVNVRQAGARGPRALKKYLQGIGHPIP